MGEDACDDVCLGDLTAHDYYLNYAGPAAVLGKTETHALTLLAEVTKSFLRDRCIHFIQEANNKALLSQFSSDSTPIRHKVRERCAVDGIVVDQRAGGFIEDYLVQNQFFRWKNTCGRWRSQVFLRIGLRLKHSASSRESMAIWVFM